MALFNSEPRSNAFGPNPKQVLDQYPQWDGEPGKRPARSWQARVAKAVALVVAAAAILSGVAWLWWVQNSAEFLANGKAHFEQGRAAGRTLDESGCVARATGALAGEAGSSLTAGIANSVGLSGCLEASRATAGFCDDIPLKTDIFGAAQWIASTCNQMGYAGNTSCTNLIQLLPAHCASPERSRKVGAEGVAKT
jgi:hypothetical protein